MAATFLELRTRVTPAALADEIVGAIDRRLPAFEKTSAAIKNYPLIAAGVVAGVGFLIRQALNGHPAERPAAPARDSRRIRNRRQQPSKGDET
ncbi:MAG: hypothetical protein ACKVP5_03275 [Aestuariivirga sp.]